MDLGKYFYRKQFVSSTGANYILKVYHQMLWGHNVANGMQINTSISLSVCSVQGLNYAVRFLKDVHMLREYLVSVA